MNRHWILPLFLIARAAAGQSPALETRLRASLLSSLNTETSRKGDTVTAQVLSPEAFRGAILEGRVQESKSGAKLKGSSLLHFSFDKLSLNNRVIPVQATVEEMANSRGVKGVDEEGRILKKKNSLGKVAVATGIGAAIGAAVGGGKGAGIGAAAGAAAGLIFVEVGTEGANLSFAPGSEFVLNVKERR